LKQVEITISNNNKEYTIIFLDNKIYISNCITQEGMEVKEDNFLKMIDSYFKRNL